MLTQILIIKKYRLKLKKKKKKKKILLIILTRLFKATSTITTQQLQVYSCLCNQTHLHPATAKNHTFTNSTPATMIFNIKLAAIYNTHNTPKNLI
jgi:hypothetical protein